MNYKQFINEFEFPNTTKAGEKLLMKQGKIAKNTIIKKYKKQPKMGTGKAFNKQNYEKNI